METGKEKTWTTGRILAVVIPVCVGIIAVTVALVLVLANSGDGEGKAGEDGTAAEEEMVETYEQIKQEADAAVAEMEDLETQEATSDPAAYEQELEEALTAYEQLIADLDDTANAAAEVSQDYEEMYAYIYEYYNYFYDLAEQAVSQINNLLAQVPAMQGQAENLMERLEDLPAKKP